MGLFKNNVLHRDLKPDNILVKATSSLIIIKLADLGLSTHLVSSVKGAAGTKGFKPKELYRFSLSYGNDCDVFSIGAIAIFLLTNKHPSTRNCVDMENGSSN